MNKKALPNTDTSYKKSYPNYDNYISYPSPRKTDKWVDAVKTIYYRVHKGEEKSAALQNVIAGWDKMEQLDFKNWIKYYEEKAHKKYSEAEEKPARTKIAQVSYWANDNKPGYFLPIQQERSVGDDIDFAKDPKSNSLVHDEEKRELIEKQRNKIVSRLDSAEKLLRSQEGQLFAGNEFETLMHIIYELKKKIHTVNKITTSTRLYEDMIIREANILTKKGFTRASDYLFKLADDAALSASQPDNPMTSGGGLPGAVPGQAPGQMPMPNNSPTNSQLPGETEKPISPGMKGFLDGLAGDEDETDAESAEDDELEVQEAEDWIVEAQAAPDAPPPDAAPEPAPPAPKPAATKKAPVGKDQPLEVAEDPEVVAATAFDQKMDQMLQGIKIEDALTKLEDLAKIYKTRELPRQLSLVDMMLNHLGIGTFFPELAEATTRSLDSNQYILTRLDGIISRLRGLTQTNPVDLKNQNAVPSTPELDAAKNKLQQDQDKDKAKKQMKKQQEESQLGQAAKPEPELEVEEDLGGPVETTNAAPPAPPAASPAAPPAAPAR